MINKKKSITVTLEKMTWLENIKKAPTVPPGLCDVPQNVHNLYLVFHFPLSFR